MGIYRVIKIKGTGTIVHLLDDKGKERTAHISDLKLIYPGEREKELFQARGTFGRATTMRVNPKNIADLGWVIPDPPPQAEKSESSLAPVEGVKKKKVRFLPKVAVRYIPSRWEPFTATTAYDKTKKGSRKVPNN